MLTTETIFEQEGNNFLDALYGYLMREDPGQYIPTAIRNMFPKDTDPKVKVLELMQTYIAGQVD